MKTLWLFAAAVCTLLTASCGNNHRKAADWLTSDDVHIAVDETFRPIIEEELEVFSLNHPEAAMKPLWVSENEALRLLVSDSIRSCIATRKLTEREKEILKSHTLTARQAIFASDAIALIVNKENPDTLITLDEIKGILSGKITHWEQLEHGDKQGEIKLVFDHEGSSTVRYMVDSLLDGQPLKANVFAQGSNQAVIDIVKESTDVIGVVGTDWLRQEGDSIIKDFRDLSLNVMKVSRFSGAAAAYFRPYQYYIATAEYPLIRSVYVICTDPRTQSMPKNFFFFIKGQRGQLVICNGSQMLPYMPVQVKDVTVR